MNRWASRNPEAANPQPTNRGGEVVKQYATIVADPPWPIHDVRTRPVIGKEGRRMRATKFPYEVMSMDDIRALPIVDLAADDCRLFMWVAHPFDIDGGGLSVAEAWGFDRLRRPICWQKPSFGMGLFPRPGHELLFIAERGKPEWTDAPELRRTHSVQEWNQPRAKGNGGKIHSAKPDASLDLIERVSPGPYVELFARRARFGWDYWGDQSLGTAEMVGVA